MGNDVDIVRVNLWGIGGSVGQERGLALFARAKGFAEVLRDLNKARSPGCMHDFALGRRGLADAPAKGGDGRGQCRTGHSRMEPGGQGVMNDKTGRGVGHKGAKIGCGFNAPLRQTLPKVFCVGGTGLGKITRAGRYNRLQATRSFIASGA